MDVVCDDGRVFPNIHIGHLTHCSPIVTRLVRFDSAATSIKLPISGRLFPMFKDIMYGNGNATIADFVLGSDFTALEKLHF